MAQGLPVHGYRDQKDDAIKLVNENKIAEEKILRVIDYLQASGVEDGRWLAIARTHLEQGFMALNRAIFKPQRVKLDGD